MIKKRWMGPDCSEKTTNSTKFFPAKITDAEVGIQVFWLVMDSSHN